MTPCLTSDATTIAFIRVRQEGRYPIHVNPEIVKKYYAAEALRAASYAVYPAAYSWLGR